MDPGEPVLLYVGIDQHRKQLTVSVRDESGNVLSGGRSAPSGGAVRAPDRRRDASGLSEVPWIGNTSGATHHFGSRGNLQKRPPRVLTVVEKLTPPVCRRRVD